MSSVNRQVVLGRIGQDATVRHLDGGILVANFSVATSEKYKNKAGETVENTEWHNIVAWRGLAEYAEKYCKKGLMIYLEGKTTHPKFTDKEGQDRQKCEIVADVIKNLTWPQNKTPESQGPQNSPQMDSEIPEVPGDSDDLPF